MLRCVRIVALPLGVLVSVAIGACGSDGAQESGATVTQPPLAATQTVPTTTATTPTTTAQTTTAPAASTTTATTTTPATTQSSGGASPGTPTSGGAPGGCQSAVGGFIRDVRATDCGVAQSVASAWFAAVHGGAAPDTTISAAGYSCGATLDGERASVSCSGAGGGSVAFTASP